MDDTPHGHGARGADDARLIDVALLRNWIRFGAHSVVRHRWVAAAVFLATTGTTMGALSVWPKTYHVEAKLLTRRNDLMNSLSNPGRPARPEADDPTRATSELIHQHDNLQHLATQARLLDHWRDIESPLASLKDQVWRFVGSRDDAPEDAVLKMLDERLWVSVDKDGVVTLGIDWPDAQTATKIIESSLQNLVTMRHEQEESAINEAITILQGAVASLQRDVDHTIAQLRDEQARTPAPPPPRRVRPRAAPAAAVKPAPVAAAASPSDLARLGQLHAALDAKKQQVTRLETLQRQQVADLQARLTSALTIYTEDHPTVKSLRETLAAVSRDAPELTNARADVETLQQEITTLADASVEQQQAAAAAAAAAVPPITSSAGRSADVESSPSAPLVAVLPADGARLADLQHPSSRLLTLQLAQLANLLDRINAARLELATSTAGLKYRYRVTKPPEVPVRPARPNVVVVSAAGVVLSLLLALLAALTIDLTAGIVLEPWQVDRSAGVTVLAILNVADAARETAADVVDEPGLILNLLIREKQ